MFQFLMKSLLAGVILGPFERWYTSLAHVNMFYKNDKFILECKNSITLSSNHPKIE